MEGWWEEADSLSWKIISNIKITILAWEMVSAKWAFSVSQLCPIQALKLRGRHWPNIHSVPPSFCFIHPGEEEWFSINDFPLIDSLSPNADKQPSLDILIDLLKLLSSVESECKSAAAIALMERSGLAGYIGSLRLAWFVCFLLLYVKQQTSSSVCMSLKPSDWHLSRKCWALNRERLILSLVTQVHDVPLQRGMVRKQCHPSY